jgi:hypothetical protein
MGINRNCKWCTVVVLLCFSAQCYSQFIPWGTGRRVTPVHWSVTNKASGINVNFTDTLTWRATSTNGIGIANVGYSTGNRYFEITPEVLGGNVQMFGLTTIVPLPSNTNLLGFVNASIGWRGQSGGTCVSYNFGSNGNIGIGCTAIAVGQKIGIAHNADSGIVRFFVNGVYQSQAILTSVPTGVTWYPACAGNVSIGTGGTAAFSSTSWTYDPNADLLPFMTNYKMINE